MRYIDIQIVITTRANTNTTGREQSGRVTNHPFFSYPGPEAIMAPRGEEMDKSSPGDESKSTTSPLEVSKKY